MARNQNRSSGRKPSSLSGELSGLSVLRREHPLPHLGEPLVVACASCLDLPSDCLVGLSHVGSSTLEQDRTVSETFAVDVSDEI
jgi:hypothetical protein